LRDLLVSVISGALLAFLGVVATRTVEWAKRRRRLGHLYALASKGKRVQIIIPSFNVPEFLVQGTNAPARIPPNVRLMPMAEGGAIAELVQALHQMGKYEVRLVTQNNYQDSSSLTICIGGPSVNSISREILRLAFPAFNIRYPEHIASYGTTTFVPSKSPDGSLLEDYGFMAVTRTPRGSNCLVLCGVWAPGTQIATTTLLSLKHHSEVARLIREGKEFFAVSYARVNGLEQHDSQLIELRRRKDEGER
jgi:hypothetical protein